METAARNRLKLRACSCSWCAEIGERGARIQVGKLSTPERDTGEADAPQVTPRRPGRPTQANDAYFIVRNRDGQALGYCYFGNDDLRGPH